MIVVLVTDVIHRGGAETFMLRLAEGLQKNGHRVILFIFHQNRIDAELKNLLAPSVHINTPDIRNLRFWRRTDGLFYYLPLSFSPLRFFYQRALKKLVRTQGVQVMHSHLFTADLVATSIGTEVAVPVVTTLHGDYALYAKSKAALAASRIKNFTSELKQVVNRLGAIVCITGEQQVAATALKQELKFKAPVTTIYNGYTLPKTVPPLTRQELNVPETAFVVGMVARGIKEKGWKELIEAFLSSGIPNACLLLVGDGDYLQQLKKQYASPLIRFIGSVVNPIQYIRLFDVACLPSYFESESLPTAVIEYLFCGKPVIATAKGEIPAMLRSGTAGQCGTLVEIDTEEKMVASIRQALANLFSDKTLYDRYKSKTESAAADFEMDRCVRQYEKVYENAIRASKKQLPLL